MVTERNYLPLSDEARKLILARVRELAQLDTLNFCADGGCQMYDVGHIGQEIWVRRVRILASVVELIGLEQRILLFWIPSWEIVDMLSRIVQYD